jgi:hypothetical protein
MHPLYFSSTYYGTQPCGDNQYFSKKKKEEEKKEEEVEI